MTAKSLVLFVSFTLAAMPSLAGEVTQRLGGYSSSEGETRSMFKLSGRADAPVMMSGNLQSSFNLSAVAENARFKREAYASDDYIKKNFSSGQKSDRSVDGGFDWIYTKRTELSIGATRASDSVTTTEGGRASIGQWFLGDQLRVGVSAQRFFTSRPKTTPLDKDAVTLNPNAKLATEVLGTSLKVILNPTTIVTADYGYVENTDRPPLSSYALGVRQFLPTCACAVHGDFARVINLGKLNTNMTTGELTGTQWGVAYLQTLPGNLHGRIGYRYAREDEFTRAYQDHLVFGADSYTGALSKEVQGGDVLPKPMTFDMALTRYVHNAAGSATTVEMGAGMKF